jgi:two-component system chemotaxis sensor kinase CheA
MESVAAADTRERWLVFRAGAHGQMAMPLALVSRLEEFKLSVIERAGQREVVQYRGQIMPLVHVADTLQVERTSVPGDTVQVIVHSGNGTSVGLVVEEILDVVEQNVAVEGRSKRTGVLGSAVIQQHVTDLLDVPALAASAQIGA